MIEDIKLLPCPFCGESDAFVECMTIGCYAVQCNNCCCFGPSRGDESEEDDGEDQARKAWNDMKSISKELLDDSKRNNKNSLPITYATYFPMLKDIAIEHGYSLALHGSLLRDMDLIAVPWTDEAVPHNLLLRSFVEFIGTYVLPGGPPYQSMEEKPHGRIAYTLQCGGEGGYLDISITRWRP
jgi:hypothetical protein